MGIRVGAVWVSVCVLSWFRVGAVSGRVGARWVVGRGSYRLSLFLRVIARPNAWKRKHWLITERQRQSFPGQSSLNLFELEENVLRPKSEMLRANLGRPCVQLSSAAHISPVNF